MRLSNWYAFKSLLERQSHDFTVLNVDDEDQSVMISAKNCPFPETVVEIRQSVITVRQYGIVVSRERVYWWEGRAVCPDQEILEKLYLAAFRVPKSSHQSHG